jgi:hypothetical protein
MLRQILTTVLAAMAAIMAGNAVLGEDIPWGEKKSAPNLPPIFRERSARQRLMAEEVARQDGYRKLVERAYGLSIDSNTRVRDLALASREVHSAVQNRLKGMREADKKYFDDGRVEIAMKITVREIVEVIERTYRRVRKNGKVVSEKTLEDVKRENRDKDLIAVGRGALPDSEGLRKIRAMRAAEVDAYERLAARIFGLDLGGDTTVEDFVLKSDRIRTDLSVGIPSGVRFVRYEFVEDDSCRATGRITMREVVQILEQIYRRHTEDFKLVRREDIQNVRTENRDRVMEVVGYGTVRAFQEKDLSPASDPFSEQKSTIQRVLERKTRKERVLEREMGVEN